MNQNRKRGQDMPNRQSNMEQAQGSREQARGGSSPEDHDRSSSERSGQQAESVMDDQETFEHGSGGSPVSKGMGSTSERGTGSGSERNRGGSTGITNRGTEREQREQQKG
jgi:hypothetical protein